MTIHLTPEMGVPVPEVLKELDLHDRSRAVTATAELLASHGLDLDEDDDTSGEVASTLAMAYAKAPEKTSQAVSNARAAKLPPTTLLKVKSLLDEYGGLVAQQAEQVRNLVVNKLLLETESPDPKVRVKALELVGKMSGIDLFTDRKEVTIKHESSDELKNKLREKLERLRAIDAPAESAEFTEIPPILDGVEIDVDATLGLKPETPEGGPKNDTPEVAGDG